MKPLPTEFKLTGAWTLENGRMGADPMCARIEWLASRYLRKIATSAEGWETLYQDPADQRLWERTYPHGEMHGGGPPQLAVIGAEAASVKYKIDL